MKQFFTTIAFSAMTLSLTAQIDSGLVARYEFDNTIPDTFDGTRDIYPEDIMGKHTWFIHDGVTQGMDRNGNANMAADFDGLDDDLLYVDDVLVDVEEDLTLSYWLYLDNYPSTSDLLSYTITNRHDENGDERPGIDMAVNTSHKLSMVLRGANAASLVNIESVDTFALNTWYHITVTKEGEIMELFIDCVSQGTSTIPNYNATISLFPDPDFWSFGGMYGDDGTGTGTVEVIRKLDGRLDNVYFYNRILTSVEMDTLCNDLMPVVSTSVDELEANQIVNLYPNPAQNQVNLELGNAYQAAMIEIYNAQGQLVGQEQVNGSLHTIAIENLETGMYWISIRNNNGEMRTLSFIKEG